jgi:N4-gp56 family major capsid protein
MASFTTTTHSKFIPEVWSKEVILARESRLYMANLVMRLDSDVAEYGNKIHLPNVSNLTAAAIGSDGSLTDTAPTETEVTLTINRWMGVSINVPDIVMHQSKYDLLKLYAEKMGYALALVVETDLLGQYSSLTTNSVGTAGTDLTDATLRSAVQKLDDARAPFEERDMVIKPVQKNALLGIDKFVRYDVIPRTTADNPVLKGNIGELYGVSVHVSPEILTSSGETQNLMFQHDAFALAMQ